MSDQHSDMIISDSECDGDCHKAHNFIRTPFIALNYPSEIFNFEEEEMLELHFDVKFYIHFDGDSPEVQVIFSIAQR